MADLSAENEEATGDEQARIKDNELWITVPMTNPTMRCILCEKKNKRLEFLTLRELSAYLSEQHRARTKWICSKCEKGFEKLHATLCHIPKCKILKSVVKSISAEPAQKVSTPKQGGRNMNDTDTLTYGTKREERRQQN